MMSFGKEKSDVEHIVPAESETSVDAHLEQYRPEQQKKIMRRVDRRLVTILGLLYMCSLMDRTNVGVAKIAG
jgi:hypothetical protein